MLYFPPLSSEFYSKTLCSVTVVAGCVWNMQATSKISSIWEKTVEVYWELSYISTHKKNKPPILKTKAAGNF